MSGQETNVVFLPVEDAARGDVAALWETLLQEADAAVRRDQALVRAMNSAVLMHAGFGDALSHRLAVKLADHDVDRDELLALIHGAYTEKPALLGAASTDLQAVKDRDPSNSEVLTPFLYFKGFSALQGHRVAHWLWSAGRRHLARHIQSRISEVFRFRAFFDPVSPLRTPFLSRRQVFSAGLSLD